MATKMKIIGITGRARSGKDTLANFLVEHGEAERMSFANPVRRFISKLTGIKMDDLLDGPLKEQPLPEFGGKSPRQMMQTLGTEWGRDLIDPNLWITVARKELEFAANYPLAWRPELVVFSDVRFENEAAMIRELGGQIIHIRRPGAEAVNSHVSEAGVRVAHGDVVVNNEFGLDHLREVAKHFAA